MPIVVPACRRAPSRRVPLVAALVITVATTWLSMSPPAHAEPARPPEPTGRAPAPVYRPPVDAALIDPFRAPAAGGYGAGNRGLDYATAPLTPVRAVADGEVIFAGPVAGTLHVTVRHADGLRSSYSFLASVTVGRGRHVRQGEPVGLSAEVLHVGVRDPAGTYLDPALLFARSTGAHLVPGGDDGAGPPVGDEPSVLARVVADRLAPLQRAIDELRPSPGRLTLRDRLRLWTHLAVESTPAPHALRVLRGVHDWYRDRHDCTPADVPPPPPTARRILVTVAGFGSTSGPASVDDVDAGTLGYAPGDVVRFSYNGGRVPGPGPVSDDLAGVPVSSYDAADSQDDLSRSGRELADLLDELARAAPGVPIDVVAHSQGGVVARLALVHAEDAGTVPPALRTLVALGSPHDGADLAGAVVAGRLTPEGARAEDVFRDVVGLHADPARPAGAQLAPTSSVIRSLTDRPPPPTVRAMAVGARGDLVVPANRTRIPGADHTIVGARRPSAHGELPGDPAATREIALAVAGRPPTCRGLTSVVADLVDAEQIALAETHLALPAAVAAASTSPWWPLP